MHYEASIKRRAQSTRQRFIKWRFADGPMHARIQKVLSEGVHIWYIF